jgi:hypothetical protein
VGVRAAHPPDAQVVPDHCTIYYHTLKSGAGVRGERGSVTMSLFRDLATHDLATDDEQNWRNFSFDGKPFKSVTQGLADLGLIPLAEGEAAASAPSDEVNGFIAYVKDPEKVA